MPGVPPMTTMILLAMALGVTIGFILIARTLRRPRAKNAVMMCRRCRTPNPDHARFCAKCGLRLR